MSKKLMPKEFIAVTQNITNIHTEDRKFHLHLVSDSTGETLEAIIAAAGTGLGVSIVKSLVEAHQGELKIKSKEHIGTTVIVSFPLCNE